MLQLRHLLCLLQLQHLVSYHLRRKPTVTLWLQLRLQMLLWRSYKHR